MFVSGRFRFGVRTWLTLPGNRGAEITDARDALAERVLAGILQLILRLVLSPRCFHLKDRGGLKAAVREVMREAGENRFVFRTDVRSYYESVNHGVLWSR